MTAKHHSWENGDGADVREPEASFHGLFSDPSAVNPDGGGNVVVDSLKEAEKAAIIMGVGIGLMLGIPVLALFGGISLITGARRK